MTNITSLEKPRHVGRSGNPKQAIEYILSLVARRDVFFCKDIPLYWYNYVNTRTKTSMVDNEQQAMMKVFGHSSNV